MDHHIVKLQDMIARRRASDANARITDAARHLRLAMDLIAGVETTPPVAEAATLMDISASVLLRYLDDGDD